MVDFVKMLKFCILCGRQIDDYGHNAEPLARGRCCNSCNEAVIESRIELVKLKIYINKLIKKSKTFPELIATLNKIKKEL